MKEHTITSIRNLLESDRRIREAERRYHANSTLSTLINLMGKRRTGGVYEQDKQLLRDDYLSYVRLLKEDIRKVLRLSEPHVWTTYKGEDIRIVTKGMGSSLHVQIASKDRHRDIEHGPSYFAGISYTLIVGTTFRTILMQWIERSQFDSKDRYSGAYSTTQGVTDSSKNWKKGNLPYSSAQEALEWIMSAYTKNTPGK